MARAVPPPPLLSFTDEPLLDFIPRVSTHIVRPTHLAPLAAVFERIRRGERVRACVSVPAQHGKTTLIQHAIVWLLAADPTLPMAYVTYAQDLADSKSWETRQIALRAGIAFAADRQNLREWRTTAGGWGMWTGVDGPLTGSAARVLITDDPFKNRVEAESLHTRDRVHAWYTSVVLTRLPEDGSALVVHTRWHDDDLIGRLAKEGYEVINLPFLANEAGDYDPQGEHVLWPRTPLPSGRVVGWTPAGARERLREVGPYDAASIYGGTPRPKGGRVFHEPTRYHGRPDLTGARLFLAEDPAGSDDPKANCTVAVALAVRGYGAAMTADLVGLLRFRLRPEEAAPRLLKFQRRFGATLHIEGSRDGKEHVRILKILAPGIDVERVPPIGDKFLRAQGAAAAWNAEPARIRVPAQAADIDVTDDDLAAFLRVVSRFTGVGDAEDDDADALAHAWNAAMESTSTPPPSSRPRVGGMPRTAGW